MFMRSPMHPDRFIFAQAAKADRRADRKKSRAIVRAVAKKKNREANKPKAFSPNYQTVPYQVGLKAEFYATREWRELRWKVLSTSTGECMACGRSHSKHGVIMHIDHIKPRSRFPSLELDITNLQVLCEDCNLGKGAS